MIKKSLTAIILFSVVCFTLAGELPNQAHVVVIGYGNVMTEPDMAFIKCQVLIEQPTLSQAKQSADSIVSDFLAGLTKLGIKEQDIGSSILRATTVIDYSGKISIDQRVKGYRVTRNIGITLRKLDTLNKVISLAFVAGINQVNHIELKSSEEGKLIKQAKILAIEDAKQQAKELASAFASQLDAIYSVQYQYGAVTPINPYAYKTSAANSGEGTFLLDKLNYDATVRVVYTLKNN